MISYAGSGLAYYLPPAAVPLRETRFDPSTGGPLESTDATNSNRDPQLCYLLLIEGIQAAARLLLIILASFWSLENRPLLKDSVRVVLTPMIRDKAGLSLFTH